MAPSAGRNVIKTVKGYEQLVNTIVSVKNGVSLVFTWFTIILAVVSVFIIINTIKLSVYARRNEIMVMRYVGASRTFITLPFVGEGVIIGVISSVVAYFLERLAYRGVLGYLADNTLMQIIKVIPFSEVSLWVFLSFLGIGIVSGVIGSCISLVRYSKS